MAKISLTWTLIISAILVCIQIMMHSVDAIVAKRRCRKSSGSLEDVSWIYTPGVDCYNCEVKTVQAAIQNHLDTQDTANKISCTQCLDLSYSVSWTGHLLIGPTAGFNSTMYCGPQLSSYQEGGSKFHFPPANGRKLGPKFSSLPASGPKPTTIKIDRVEL
ncbi:29363692-d8a7-40b9-b5b5-0ffcbdc665b8 [Sclerotinia trifoliorum]|uniref:29363692-d8a7-40b9-b5b5-0ffcbdc665b8 n=1 Tax=Sclerotinia trifoliorum TaxID=28548 RepID=A0A8H2ZMK9_9HELO|nr:29363692-d8a7-40b9-b5b5-0ffcbdc665b8 [Sclerotinia trifoliorum]